jgi:hypothetical protein
LYANFPPLPDLSDLVNNRNPLYRPFSHVIAVLCSLGQYEASATTISDSLGKILGCTDPASCAAKNDWDNQPSFVDQTNQVLSWAKV